jgi:hypothetical protein
MHIQINVKKHVGKRTGMKKKEKPEKKNITAQIRD